MAKGRKSSGQQQQQSKKSLTSTTSLGKRRSLGKREQKKRRSSQESGASGSGAAAGGGGGSKSSMGEQSPRATDGAGGGGAAGNASNRSTMSNPRSAEYGSQSSPIRIPAAPSELTKVAILGAAGGIGQPLAMLLMLHSEYVHHLALHDLMDSIRGVATDLSHIDRQCKVTGHLGMDELAEAVRGARVILVPAGLAQKPGMSRDDLFGSNAKIMYNLAKVCAQVAPDAMLAIISNPVNSLVPLACEVYSRFHGSKDGVPLSPPQNEQQATTTTNTTNTNNTDQTNKQETTKQQQQQQQPPPTNEQHSGKPKSEGKQIAFHSCLRRVFGVTTLDVVRASSLTAKSALFRPETNGLFKDPAKLQVPVVGGHAGKTIIPLLSQATPKLDRKRLTDDKATISTVIESIQQAGIDVLNDKKGKGSATLAMAYAACRFTISLLRAIQGEQNIIECAYVRHQTPVFSDLDYFSTPLLLAKDGYSKSLGVGKVMPFEQQMLEEAAKELRTSIAKGEDFAREHSSAEK